MGTRIPAIVTHSSPDLDAICSTWLLKTFHHKYKSAEILFVPAGSTLEGAIVDQDPMVIHVDTGFGNYDHHQLKKKTSAAELVLAELIKKDYVKEEQLPSLQRFVQVVTDFDNFKDSLRSDAASDYHLFTASEIIFGYKGLHGDDDSVMAFGFEIMASLWNVMRQRVSGEQELKEKGRAFSTPWGRTVALETKIGAIAHVALKVGYDMIISKHPDKGFVRVKQRPNAKKKLHALYLLLKKKDPHATWFYHQGGNMIINGSANNPDAIATTLSLSDVVASLESLSKKT